MGVEAAGEARTRRASDIEDEHRPPPATRTPPKPPGDAPWDKDLAALTQAPVAPIFLQTSAPNPKTEVLE